MTPCGPLARVGRARAEISEELAQRTRGHHRRHRRDWRRRRCEPCRSHRRRRNRHSNYPRRIHRCRRRQNSAP
eukprot:6421884-Pyramimonas_sp.AAC.1